MPLDQQEALELEQPVPVKTITIPYLPRRQFLPLHDTTKRWCITVAHRRCGKTVAEINKLIRKALECPRTDPRLAYAAPTYAQAKDVAWGYLLRYTEPIVGRTVHETELRVDLPTGARIRLYGLDNYDRMRGGYLDGIVLDEFGDADPRAWQEVIRPALSDRQGWADFIGTPRGRNHFFELWDRAGGDEGWLRLMLPASETGLLPEEELLDARKAMTSEQYAAEYECSFAAGLVGAYYGKEMEEADRAGRIGIVPHDPTLQVHTAWDLGIGDSTAIWLIQIAGRELHAIDYIESSGVGIDWYVKELDRRPYKWGTHVLPHDAEAKELGTGKSRIEVMKSLGLHRTRVVPRQAVDDGINAVRMLLPNMWFDKQKCQHGIYALQNYRRAWDERRKVFHERPLHDFASHGCLRGDSLVLTAKGEMPIRDVRVGDLAWTPAGWATVIAAGPTRAARNLVHLRLTDGRELFCTPEHKIMTQRGFVKVDALRYSDRVFSGKEWQCRLVSWFSTASNMGFRAAITGSGITASRGRVTFTGRSGNSITARFRMAARSIIETATASTTRLATSNASMPASINGSTHGSGRHRESFSHLLLKLWQGRQSGIARKKGEPGMSSTGNVAGTDGSGIRVFVRNAALSFIRLSLRAPSSATRIASKMPCDGAGVSQLVYDLTCKQHGCYQANGLMVSNSDAMRYWAMSNIKNATGAKKLVYPPMGIV